MQIDTTALVESTSHKLTLPANPASLYGMWFLNMVDLPDYLMKSLQPTQPQALSAINQML